jgi:hypothetical protein
VWPLRRYSWRNNFGEMGFGQPGDLGEVRVFRSRGNSKPSSTSDGKGDISAALVKFKV